MLYHQSSASKRMAQTQDLLNPLLIFFLALYATSSSYSVAIISHTLHCHFSFSFFKFRVVIFNMGCMSAKH